MNDLISRQAAIDALEAYAKKYNAYPIAVYDAVGVLQRVPSAQPERAKGRLIDCNLPLSYYANCSECGYQLNCGAYMKEKKDV